MAQIMKVINPIWSDNNKDRVTCFVRYDDGREVKASITNTAAGNPDWDLVFEQWSREDIDKNTQGHIDQKEKRAKEGQKRAEDDQRRAKNEAIFQAKLEAFEIEEIRNSKNRTMKSAIRKSKSFLEVAARTAALLNHEMYSSAKQTKEPETTE